MPRAGHAVLVPVHLERPERRSGDLDILNCLLWSRRQFRAESCIAASLSHYPFYANNILCVLFCRPTLSSLWAGLDSCALSNGGGERILSQVRAVGPAPQPPEHVPPGALVDDRQPSSAGIQRLRARKVACGVRAKGSRISGGSICWLRLEGESVDAHLGNHVDPVELCSSGFPGAP